MPGETFRRPLERDFSDVQIAWSSDFGGLPVDPRVVGVLDDRRTAFESLGCRVTVDIPDFADADVAFKVWRAWYMELLLGDMVKKHRDQFKDTIIWNVEQGEKLTGPEIGSCREKANRTL